MTQYNCKSYFMYRIPVPVLNIYRWHTDSWLLQIYCKNVCSDYTSYIALLHLCKFLLYQYALNVATISSCNLLKLTTHLKWQGDTSIPQHLCTTQQAFLSSKIYWMVSMGTPSSRLPTKRSCKEYGLGWHVVKSSCNCADLDSGLTWHKGSKQCSHVG